jgi:hypothetical protein
MSDKQWTDDMGEISGFGGDYEACCRAMVLAGIKWVDENPSADPHYKGFKNVYGLVMEDNDDAKALTKAIIDAAAGEATGAMHQASVGHVLAYKRLGWDEYSKQLREREPGEDG